MKALVANYKSNLSTECMYISRCLQEVGVEAHFWDNPNVSTFDAFDQIQPDTFFTHFGNMNEDVVKYLSQAPQIRLILNATGANNEMIANMSKQIKQFGINCPLLFTNTHNLIHSFKSPDIKMVSILPALDIFQQPQDSVPFSLDAGVISSQPVDVLDQITCDYESFHRIGVGAAEGYDLYADTMALRSLYDKYDEMTIVDNIFVVMSQLFFELSMYSKKLRIELPPQHEEIFNKILPTLFSEQKSDNVQDVIRDQIRKKHNCFTRISRLMFHIGETEISKRLKDVGDQV